MNRPRNNLIKARKEAGFTQEALATKVEISRAYLSNIEKGKHTPSLDVAGKISFILDKTVEELFFASDVQKTHSGEQTA